MDKLSDAKVNELLNGLTGWQLSNSKLVRKYQFKNFVQNMRFITQMAHLAEEEGHHPDFHVHYNQLDVEIWTHDANGLTENDFRLAEKINEIEA